MTTHRVRFVRVYLPSQGGSRLTSAQEDHVEALIKNAGVQQYLQGLGWTWVEANRVSTIVEYYDV